MHRCFVVVVAIVFVFVFFENQTASANLQNLKLSNCPYLLRIYDGAHAAVNMWSSEDNFWVLVLSVCPVSPRFKSRSCLLQLHLDPLSHLTSPSSCLSVDKHI